MFPYFTRREFIKSGITAVAASHLLPFLPLNKWATADDESEPHFFLLIVLNGGADPMYLSDSRPLALTNAGLVQNYSGEDPTPWLDQISSLGGQCLTLSTMAPLRAYASDFSIINGVLMAQNTDGHSNNLNFFLSGSPTGGEAFMNHLNRGSNKHSLDTIQIGEIRVDINGRDNTLALEAATWQKLLKTIHTAPTFDLSDPVLKFVNERTEEISFGHGLFSIGAKKLHESFSGATQTNQTLRKMNLSPDEKDPLQQSLELLRESFRARYTRSFLLVLEEDRAGQRLDTHDAGKAALQPKVYREVAERLATVMGYLKNTPFDSQRSLYDVTTFAVTSDFGRTMRQSSKKVNETGTDHNTLSNSVLMGGKGIRGGLVVGGSDRQTVEEPLSAIHTSRDPQGMRVMGRPFDFDTLRPRTEWPSEFAEGDFLSCGNVVNTIYKLFGAPDSYLRTYSDKKVQYRVLERLLS